MLYPARRKSGSYTQEYDENCALPNASRKILKNLEELKASAREAWAKITTDDINRHIDKMEDRIKAVLKARGGHTKY